MKTLLLPPLLLAALASTAAFAQTPDSARRTGAEVPRPTLEIRRASGPIRIDGELDDAGWAEVARVTSFVEAEPNEGAKPPVETEAVISYDDKNLYVAFVAHDQPKEIRATWRERDQIFNDDFVGIAIDPYGDAAFGYILLANPFGIQADLQQTPQEQDPKMDLIFETAARITSSGYQVEMAIPFSSLRFPDRAVQSWKVNLVRNYPRASRHLITWAPLSRGNPCLLCQNGVLAGIEGVRPGGGLELLPAVVASQSGSLGDARNPGSFENRDPSAEASLGAKYAFRSGWTVEGTYNPDFSQVESDAAQIDVNSTFALFFPERRPFFQEGSDLFETEVNVFYSRSINDPQLASKVTGRAGKTSVGYIGARDEHTPFILPFQERSAILQGGASFTNVLRVRHNLEGGSQVGALLTDRRLEGGGSGTAAGVDASIRFRKVYRLEAQVVGSYTTEPTDTVLTRRIRTLEFGRGNDVHTAAFDGESYGGRATHLRLDRSARFWRWSLGYRDATPAYRADNGFQTRNDFRRLTAGTGWTFYPKRGWVERISPGIDVGTSWNFAGERKEEWVSPRMFTQLKRQSYVGINTSFNREVFRGREFEGIRRFGVFGGSNFSDAVGFELFVGRNRSIARNLSTPVLGEGLDFNVSATLKPMQRLVIQPSFGYAELHRVDSGEEVFSGYILRTRANYQFTRELSARVVAQYNDFSGGFDLEPLLVYRLNPFSIFYVGSTHGFRDFAEGVGLAGTDRQFFLKFQYLFRP
jgi:hypothetical protein